MSDEQETVQRVEGLFALAGQLEERLAKASPETPPPTKQRRNDWNGSKRTMNPSPIGAPENSPAIHRWVIARQWNESCQGRKNLVVSKNGFFRPSGALSFFHPQPTVETVGYGHASLAGLQNPCPSVA